MWAFFKLQYIVRLIRNFAKTAQCFCQNFISVEENKKPVVRSVNINQVAKSVIKINFKKMQPFVNSLGLLNRSTSQSNYSVSYCTKFHQNPIGVAPGSKAPKNLIHLYTHVYIFCNVMKSTRRGRGTWSNNFNLRLENVRL